jgi:hypothetical protein
MNEKQALDVIKAALDLATSKGVFQNLDSTYAVVQAFNVISEKVLKSDDDSAG